MKHLIPFLFLFVSSTGFGQVVVGMPELMVFYRGYDNPLEAAPQIKVKKIKLESPDFEFTVSEDKTIKNYSCTARVTSSVSRGTIYMLNAKTNEPIDTFEVTIKTLPDPSLYFGAADPGGKINKTETKFFAKYRPEVPMVCQFQIVSGTIMMPDKTLRYFSGNQLSESVSKEIQALPDGSTIWVETYTIGPDGRWRIVKSTFQI